jgi:hypothetical protein
MERGSLFFLKNFFQLRTLYVVTQPKDTFNRRMMVLSQLKAVTTNILQS